MKSLFFLLALLTVGTSLTIFAADNDSVKGTSQIGLTFSSFGSNDLVSFQKGMMGGPGYKSDGFKTFGINYIYRFNRTFDFETGIEYAAYKIIVEPNLPLIYMGTPYLAKFSLIQIPVTIRVNFLKYFFVNGGVFLDIEAAGSNLVASQNGIGANLGLGLKYDLTHSITLFVNPYTKFHSIIPITSKVNQQWLLESGFRFGMTIGLGK